MAQDDLVEAAREWLDETLADLGDSGLYEKSGEDLVNRLEREIRRQSAEAEGAIRTALGGWLDQPFSPKASWAIALVGRLNITEHREKLQTLLADVQSGRLRASYVVPGIVEAALRRLS